MYGIWVIDSDGAEDWLRESGEAVAFENEADGKAVAIARGAIQYREWEVRRLWTASPQNAIYRRAKG